MDPTELRWRRSSHSMGNGGNCVEVADTEHTVFVRDSKDLDGPAFRCGREQWHAFVTALGDDWYSPRISARPGLCSRASRPFGPGYGAYRCR
ncbi:DUF397 domain-containing protein [Streptomyces sp. NPDC004596]